MMNIILTLCVISSAARVLSSDRIYFEEEFPPGLAQKIWNKEQETVTEPAVDEGAVQDEDGLGSGRGLARALAAMTLRIQKILDVGRDSFVLSPVSVSGALSLLLLGATGRTESEISSLIGVDLTSPSRYSELSNYFKSIELIPVGGTVRFATGVFFQRGVSVSQEYVTNVKKLYATDVFSIDFRDSRSPSAKDAINRWVANRTEGFLKNILPFSPPSTTNAVFINVVYFEGEWEVPFLGSNVKWNKFFVTPTETVQVQLMIQLAKAYHYEDRKRGVKVVGLPYKKSELIMYFLLPTERTLDKFLSGFTEDDLFTMVNKTSLKEVIYAVPKIKLETTSELREPLKKLGLESLFTSSQDLRNIAPGIQIDSVLQKVEVQLTETGTKAAATTAIWSVRSGKPLVRLDKPFIFMLYHPTMKTILFWGTVRKPTPFSSER